MLLRYYSMVLRNQSLLLPLLLLLRHLPISLRKIVVIVRHQFIELPQNIASNLQRAGVVVNRGGIAFGALDVSQSSVDLGEI